MAIIMIKMGKFYFIILNTKLLCVNLQLKLFEKYE